MTKDATFDSLIVKDEDGNRLYDPEQIKDRTARYYEDLYKSKPRRPHPYHAEIEHKIPENGINLNYDQEDYNLLPTKEELHEIILQKKNEKSTPDLQNKMLKWPGEAMVDFLYPLITTIWNEESVPQQWNEGNITSIWKGKGDKESLNNHRGITTSSAIGQSWGRYIVFVLELR